ncbi:3-hydroxyacyl-CoA dehydrogenase NAD-binding domain-containing protein [Planctomicrobium sp. SH668]|uniref:3-hydroxyacyl-CoA dehydrogenase NAD-binding domain-containing protein n=1 Tax=Planctomicrobium sp. SH668 TaxID=3448126 RepID=UPI003F5BEE9B
MLNLKTFRVSTSSDQVLTAVLDVPERSVNVFDQQVIEDLTALVGELEKMSPRDVRFIVFRSGKAAGFLAGADIQRLGTLSSAEEVSALIEHGQALFNRIENLPIPTLALIHGACVGGGLEFALSCKFRLAVDSPETKLGLPEVKLGLIPAWGGTQRLPKKIGLSQALPMVLEGKLISASAAFKNGLVDELIDPTHIDDALNQFVQEKLSGRERAAPSSTWTRWLLDRNGVGRALVLNLARKSIAKTASHYPALPEILKAVAIGAETSDVTEEGLLVERHAFTMLALGSVSKNLIHLFLDTERAKKGSSWMNGMEPLPVRKIAVIGAGTMGAGIAQLAASRGLAVVLQDIQQEFVDRGMETIRSLFTKAVAKKAMTQEAAQSALKNIESRTAWRSDDSIDLMVEAIVEKLEVKESLFLQADLALPPRALMVSNTSALPISDMAQATKRPDKVAGLHFFNPVHKMPLVEVVRAPDTSDETIATLVALAKALGKTPIVVKQSPGFLVNRILFPYLDEAARLALEGYSLSEIDRSARKFGMPMGPIELLDVVGLDVALDVSKTLTPLAKQESPIPALFQKMVDAGHRGQKSGQGFYRWISGRKGDAAPLPEQVSIAKEEPMNDWNVNGESLDHIQQRLFLAMINESRRCLAEGVVQEAWMVDLGMVLGTGFAPFRGGPMQCIQSWTETEVVRRLEKLKERYGNRFDPEPTVNLNESVFQ